MTKMKTKKTTKVDAKVWMSRMKRFLEAQSFPEEEQAACIQFIEKFAREDLLTYLKAINAIRCYFDTTMTLGDKEMRDEHLQFCDGLTHLAEEITEATYFHLDEDTGSVALPQFPDVL